MINYSALKVDLVARGFLVTGNPIVTAAAMNAIAPVSVTQSYFFGFRDIVNVCGVATAEALIAFLKTSFPTMVAGLTVFGKTDGSAGGFDISQAAIQTWIQGGVTASKISQAQANSLIALGTISVPYIQQTYGVAALIADDINAAWRQ